MSVRLPADYRPTTGRMWTLFIVHGVRGCMIAIVIWLPTNAVVLPWSCRKIAPRKNEEVCDEHRLARGIRAKQARRVRAWKLRQCLRENFTPVLTGWARYR